MCFCIQDQKVKCKGNCLNVALRFNNQTNYRMLWEQKSSNSSSEIYSRLDFFIPVHSYLFFSGVMTDLLSQFFLKRKLILSFCGGGRKTKTLLSFRWWWRRRCWPKPLAHIVMQCPYAPVGNNVCHSVCSCLSLLLCSSRSLLSSTCRHC